MLHYFCGKCNTHWPDITNEAGEPRFVLCPRCQVSTAKNYGYGTAPLPEAEAIKLANQCEFDRYLEQETEEEAYERRERWEQSKLDEELERESRSAELREKFAEVIAQGGFEEWELEQVEGLELELASAHVES